MRSDFILLKLNALEKPFHLIASKENALSPDGMCAKQKYLSACILDRELNQVETGCNLSSVLLFSLVKGYNLSESSSVQ